MIVLVALVPTLILGLLLWRTEKRYDEAEKAWRLERTGLLTRIQNPGIIPPQELPEPTGDQIHVPLDDDDAYAKYVEDRELGLVS